MKFAARTKPVVVRSNLKLLEDAQRERADVTYLERVMQAYGNPLREALLVAALQRELAATRDPEMAECLRDLLRELDRAAMS